MNGGDKLAIVAESLSDIIIKQRTEIDELKSENQRLLTQLSLANGNAIIKSVVKETVKALPNSRLYYRITKKKKQITKNRIINLASNNDMSISEVYEIVVEQDQLCSKATFYRYIKELQKNNLIDIAQINENKVLVSSHR